MNTVDDSRDKKTILVFAKDGRIAAAKVSTVPMKIRLQGETFVGGRGGLGDYDYVRNSLGELVGFAFDLSPREHRLLTPISKVKGVHLRETEVFFLLADADDWSRECIQATSQLYRSRSGNLLIALDKWAEFGPLGFAFEDVSIRLCP